jgi:hypothetical protein
MHAYVALKSNAFPCGGWGRNKEYYSLAIIEVVKYDKTI